MEENTLMSSRKEGNRSRGKKGYTLLEVITTLGIMSLISLLITGALSFSFKFNNMLSEKNDKEYTFNEFMRYVKIEIKSLNVNDVLVDTNKIMLTKFKKNIGESDRMIIFAENEKVKVDFYKTTNGGYYKTGSRAVLKEVNRMVVNKCGNMLYVKVFWRAGGYSISSINLE